MSLRLAITLIISAVLGYMMGLEAASSDPVLVQILGGLFFLGIFGITFLAVPSVAVWAVWNRWTHRGKPLVRSEPETGSFPKRPPSRRFLKLLALLLVAACASTVGERRTHPAHIRYDIATISDSWHEVQIHHLEKGQWIEGPWVGKFPLKVSFPDLNGDGHEDIEVTGHSHHATFLYLPQNDGKKYWELQEQEGYAVSYAPGGYIWP